MTKAKPIISAEDLTQLLAQDGDFLKPLVQTVLQELLEAEMDDTLGAGKGERAEGRKGYRNGYYTRNLVTRVGKLELRVPQDRRDGSVQRFSNAIAMHPCSGGRFRRRC